MTKSTVLCLLQVKTPVTIMITCPCNVDPLTPYFYIVKWGFTGVFIIEHLTFDHKVAGSILTWGGLCP